jgi:hypothetical protein
MIAAAAFMIAVALWAWDRWRHARARRRREDVRHIVGIEQWWGRR